MEVVGRSCTQGMRWMVNGKDSALLRAQGLGLMCLGKRGIQGKLLRRVMAPGTPLANQLGKGAEGSVAEALAAHRCGGGGKRGG